MEYKKTTKPYPPELRERAVRMFVEQRHEYTSETAALVAISNKPDFSVDNPRSWSRQQQRDSGERAGLASAENVLTHHSNRGPQYLSMKYTERLAAAQIEHSVGIVGDSYDNVLAECVIGFFKTEVINQGGLWEPMCEIEWETFNRVHRYNNQRLLELIGYIAPAEAEEAFYQNMKICDKAA